MSSLGRTNCLYKILDGKKTSRFQFSVSGLGEIHRNLIQQKNFNSRNGFFRKSPFCTFSSINPGFGGPWDMLHKKFLLPFTQFFKRILLVKKNFKFHTPVQKCHFGKIAKFMQEKVQNGDFLKKPLRELKFFVVLGFYESLEAWSAKLEAASFFAV